MLIWQKKGNLHAILCLITVIEWTKKLFFLSCVLLTFKFIKIWWKILLLIKLWRRRIAIIAFRIIWKLEYLMKSKPFYRISPKSISYSWKLIYVYQYFKVLTQINPICIRVGRKKKSKHDGFTRKLLLVKRTVYSTLRGKIPWKTSLETNKVVRFVVRRDNFW